MFRGALAMAGEVALQLLLHTSSAFVVLRHNDLGL